MVTTNLSRSQILVFDEILIGNIITSRCSRDLES